MRKLLLIFLFFVSWTAAKAQDKIITIKHDTIECRIVAVSADRISYEQKNSDSQIVGRSIPSSEVSEYLRNSGPYSFGGINYGKARRLPPEHPSLFSLQGGMAHSLTDYSSLKNYMIAGGNSASATDDYISKLQNGYYINSSLHFLLTSFFGLGIDYNLFYAAAKGDYLAQGYGTVNVPFYTKLDMDEKIYTHFAGFSVLFQEFPDLKRKIKISQTITPGFVVVRNESRSSQFQPYLGSQTYYNGQTPQYYDNANSVSFGDTFGAKASLSVDYAITPQLSAGLAGDFMWAELHKISYKTATSETIDQKLEKPSKLSHIDYGFIVRYNF